MEIDKAHGAYQNYPSAEPGVRNADEVVAVPPAR